MADNMQTTPDAAPFDPAVYRAVLKRTRRNRLLFFAVVAAYLPAVCIAYSLAPSDSVMGAVFAVWVVLLLAVTFAVAVSRCPRCGGYFHMNGMVLLVLRRCLHCQLHISDPVPAGISVPPPSVHK